VNGLESVEMIPCSEVARISPNTRKSGIFIFSYAKREKRREMDSVMMFFSYFMVPDQNPLEIFHTEHGFSYYDHVSPNQGFLSQELVFPRKNNKILHFGVYYYKPGCYFYVLDPMSLWTCVKNGNFTMEISMRDSSSQLFILMILDEKIQKIPKIVYGCCIPTISNNPLMFFTDTSKNLDGKIYVSEYYQVYLTIIIFTEGEGGGEKNSVPQPKNMVSIGSPTYFLTYFHLGPRFSFVGGILSVNLKRDFPVLEFNPTTIFFTRVGGGDKNWTLLAKILIAIGSPTYFLPYFHSGPRFSFVCGLPSMNFRSYVFIAKIEFSSNFSSIFFTGGVTQTIPGPSYDSTTLVDPYSKPLNPFYPLFPPFDELSFLSELVRRRGRGGGGDPISRVTWSILTQKREKEGEHCLLLLFSTLFDPGKIFKAKNFDEKKFYYGGIYFTSLKNREETVTQNSIGPSRPQILFSTTSIIFIRLNYDLPLPPGTLGVECVDEKRMKFIVAKKFITSIFGPMTTQVESGVNLLAPTTLQNPYPRPLALFGPPTVPVTPLTLCLRRGEGGGGGEGGTQSTYKILFRWEKKRERSLRGCVTDLYPKFGPRTSSTCENFQIFLHFYTSIIPSKNSYLVSCDEKILKIYFVCYSTCGESYLTRPQFFRNAPGLIFDFLVMEIVCKNFSLETTYFIQGKIKNKNSGGGECIGDEILFEISYYFKYPTKFSESYPILVVLKNFSWKKKSKTRKSRDLRNKTRELSVTRNFSQTQNFCPSNLKQNLIGYIPQKLLYFEKNESIITRYRDPKILYSIYECQASWPLTVSQKLLQGKFCDKKPQDFLYRSERPQKAKLISNSIEGENINWPKFFDPKTIFIVSGQKWRFEKNNFFFGENTQKCGRIFYWVLMLYLITYYHLIVLHGTALKIISKIFYDLVAKKANVFGDAIKSFQHLSFLKEKFTKVKKVYENSVLKGKRLIFKILKPSFLFVVLLCYYCCKCLTRHVIIGGCEHKVRPLQGVAHWHLKKVFYLFLQCFSCFSAGKTVCMKLKRGISNSNSYVINLFDRIRQFFSRPSKKIQGTQDLEDYLKTKQCLMEYLRASITCCFKLFPADACSRPSAIFQGNQDPQVDMEAQDSKLIERAMLIKHFKTVVLNFQHGCRKFSQEPPVVQKVNASAPKLQNSRPQAYYGGNQVGKQDAAIMQAVSAPLQAKADVFCNFFRVSLLCCLCQFYQAVKLSEAASCFLCYFCYTLFIFENDLLIGVVKYLFLCFILLIGPNGILSDRCRNVISEASTMGDNVLQAILSNGNPTEWPSLMCGPSGGTSNLKCLNLKEQAKAGVPSCPKLQTLRGCVMSPEWGHMLGNVMHLLWTPCGLTLEYITYIHSLLCMVYMYIHIHFFMYNMSNTVMCDNIVVDYTFTCECYIHSCVITHMCGLYNHIQLCINTLYNHYYIVVGLLNSILWCHGYIYLNTYVYVVGHSCVMCHRFLIETSNLLFLRLYLLVLLSTYTVGIVGVGPYHLLPMYLTLGHVTVTGCPDNFTHAQHAHSPFYSRYVLVFTNGLVRVVSDVPMVVIIHKSYVYVSTCLDLHTCLGFLSLSQ
jgi:hypothetical protein